MTEARRMGKSELFAHFAERSRKSGTELTGREFEDLIAKRLKEARLNFRRNPIIGGVQPDFLITGPRGQRVVIEAKAWDPRGGNTARALEQATHYQSLAGADKAFVVLPVSHKNFQAKGVANADGLVEAVTSFLKQPTRRDKRGKRKESSRQGTIFAAGKQLARLRPNRKRT